MYQIQFLNNYHNAGQNAEQSLCFALTGKIRKCDKVPFDKGSDIPEFSMSVKSSRFTLASRLHGNSFDEMRADFFNRCSSKVFAYVTRYGEVYEMNDKQFSSFIDEFCVLGRQSSKNGGNLVIRMRPESKKTIAWLNTLAH